jgi:hypothetical protein
MGEAKQVGGNIACGRKICFDAGWKTQRPDRARQPGDPETGRGQSRLVSPSSLSSHSGSGPARRTLVPKMRRGLQDEVKFELRRGEHPGAQASSQAC